MIGNGSFSSFFGGGITTRFLYDGDALVGEYALNGALWRRYAHGPGVDAPVVWYEGSGLGDRRGLLADHQGSIIGVSDAGGGVLYRNSYEEYGASGPGNGGRFAYTGQIVLPELGLLHYKARAYNPALGRFLQTDPVGYEDDLNLYAYVGNDPLNKTDPSGRTCTKSGTNYVCKADNLGGMAKSDPRVTKFEKNYKNTVNKLAGNPGKSVTMTMQTAKGSMSTKVSAGEVAKNLAGRTMELDPDRGGGNTRTESNVSKIGMREGDMPGVSTAKTSADERQSIKITHEGLHSTRIDTALAGGSGALARQPSADAHQVPFNNAAQELLDGVE